MHHNHQLLRKDYRGLRVTQLKDQRTGKKSFMSLSILPLEFKFALEYHLNSEGALAMTSLAHPSPISRRIGSWSCVSREQW